MKMRYEGDLCQRHEYNKVDFHIYSKKGFCYICDFYREQEEGLQKAKEDRKQREYSERDTCDNCYYGILDECGFYISCHYYPEEVQKAKDSFCSFCKPWCRRKWSSS
jgi:hypothetical protein